MISTELQATADTFVAALNTDERITAFVTAKQQFEQNDELQQLRATFSQRLPEMQQKQSDGTLTQEDMASIRSLQTKINEHPATVEMVRTQETATELLQDCNRAISEILGFDFSANAAPVGAC